MFGSPRGASNTTLPVAVPPEAKLPELMAFGIQALPVLATPCNLAVWLELPPVIEMSNYSSTLPLWSS